MTHSHATRPFVFRRSLPALLCIGLLMLGMPMAEARHDKDAAKANASTEAEQQTPSAVALYNKGVELFQVAQLQAEKGNQDGQKKLLQEAIRQFEAALDRDPAMIEAQSNIGFAYLTLHEYKDAIKAFNKALAMNPQHLNTLNGLSTAYAFNNDIDEAIKTFDTLTTLDPANAQYFFNKGSVLQKAGRMSEAVTAYNESLRIEPEDQRTLFNLGTVFENEGQLEKALPFYKRAKGVEIGNTIGLEAIRRIELIEAMLKQQASADDKGDN